MRIGIDIMGGDYAPESTISGSILALGELSSDTGLVFYVTGTSYRKFLPEEHYNSQRIEIVDCQEVIEMSDNPYKAFTRKKESGIHKAFRDLKSGRIDAFCSAGNTGAMMIGASQVINLIPGIIRPAIAANIPNFHEKPQVLLDVGLNPDTRPDVLYQYGILGKAYCMSVHNLQDPTVGLINIGIEEDKGNLASRSAYQLMTDSSDFRFAGNIEANDLFIDPGADVLVTDGFVGNIILKEAEGFYKLLKMKKIQEGFFEFFNFENFGGTPILGINKPVVVGHGISNSKAIKNMILHTREVASNILINNIKEAIE